MDSASPAPSTLSPSYRERLSPPVWAWAVVAALIFVFAWAFKAGLGWAAGVIVFVGTGLLAAYGLYRSSPVIEVTDEELKVGRAHIGWFYTGRVATLDDAATRNARTTGIDPRAYHVIRPLTSNQSVSLEVLDDDDPHPYWLISTRDPEALARAINQAQTQAHAPAGGNPQNGNRERAASKPE